MDRKAITALIIGCGIDEFMVYRDEAELGTVAVGPDGRKYRLSNEQLEAAERKQAEAAGAPAPQPETPKPAKETAKPSPKPAQRRRRTTTTRKRTAKP